MPWERFATRNINTKALNFPAWLLVLLNLNIPKYCRHQFPLQHLGSAPINQQVGSSSRIIISPVICSHGQKYFLRKIFSWSIERKKDNLVRGWCLPWQRRTAKIQQSIRGMVSLQQAWGWRDKYCQRQHRTSHLSSSRGCICVTVHSSVLRSRG